MNIQKIHHIAIICSDYQKSKQFYTQILGFTQKSEIYRQERNSYKLDLEINGVYQIELFSFPNPPQRITNPEAAGLRHLAFETNDINADVIELRSKGIDVEDIQRDEFTSKKFTFFRDPDGLPLELYER